MHHRCGETKRKGRDDERIVVIGFQHACRSSEFNGVMDRGKGSKTGNACVKKDPVELGLRREWALVRVMRRGLTWRTNQCKNIYRQRKLNGVDDDDDDYLRCTFKIKKTHCFTVKSERTSRFEQRQDAKY